MSAFAVLVVGPVFVESMLVLLPSTAVGAVAAGLLPKLLVLVALPLAPVGLILVAVGKLRVVLTVLLAFPCSLAVTAAELVVVLTLSGLVGRSGVMGPGSVHRMVTVPFSACCMMKLVIFEHAFSFLWQFPLLAQCTALFHSAVTRRCARRGMLTIPSMMFMIIACMCASSGVGSRVSAGRAAIAAFGVRFHARAKLRPYDTYTSCSGCMVLFAMIETQYAFVIGH